MFQFTPAISCVVNCTTQDEIDHYWDRLGELMSGPDPERSNRVMQALMKVVKLDIAELETVAG